jgi:hypothetical protein
MTPSFHRILGNKITITQQLKRIIGINNRSLVFVVRKNALAAWTPKRNSQNNPHPGL